MQEEDVVRVGAERGGQGRVERRVDRDGKGRTQVQLQETRRVSTSWVAGIRTADSKEAIDQPQSILFGVTVDGQAESADLVRPCMQ